MHGDSQGPGRDLRVLQFKLLDSVCRIPEDGDTRSPGYRFLEQRQPLSAQFRGKYAQPRDVSTRPGEAGDEPVPDWVGADRHDYGNRAGRLLQRTDRRLPRSRDEDVHLETDEFSRQVRESLRSSLCASILDGDVVALKPAKVAETLTECVEVLWGLPGPQPTYPGHLLRLRLGGKRRGEKAEGGDRDDPENHRRQLLPPRSRSRAMMSRKISLVPPPNRRKRESRRYRCTGNSVARL